MEWLQNAESLVKTIAKPVSDDDARALAKLFGPDECFGFGWTVLHLIETAPGWPLPDVLAMPKNEWIERLKKRVENAKRFK
ncbi:MAG TPA: hypothetical protein VGO52_06490 [Hyphomonadaceae bacterium]|nr:hypothetical protein [Hyphomonadaceae bacterium]